jgi:N6-adenosine-specific RNA methylase IME4
MKAPALTFHPLANIFPLLEGEPFNELVADVRAHGLREPIMLFEGQILDGRNRYRASLEAGSPPLFRDYLGNDPIGFVVSKNLHRRHLTDSQRAMVAAKLATMRQGARTDISPIGEMSQAKAAALLNVGKRSVERAAEVRDHGAPELQSAVERGVVSVAAAADVASLTKDAQCALLAKMDKREILRAAQEIRAERATARRADQHAKLLSLSNANAPLSSDRKYPVILADPPYRFDHQRSVDREPENHYPTLSTEQICALPVSDLATDDAVLFLWTPAPMLPHALNIIRRWGFEYLTHAVWVKDKIGLGTYLRHQHELLLIGYQGNHIARDPSRLPSSVIHAPRREHSRKPDEGYELIERMYPGLPKIELFARNARAGWAAWGNQAPTRAAS